MFQARKRFNIYVFYGKVYYFKIQTVIDLLESQGFIIKNMIKRELMKEEVINLFYKHQKKPYFEELLSYILGGECVILLLCHETEDPINKWKKLIGPSDPLEAKVSIFDGKYE